MAARRHGETGLGLSSEREGSFDHSMVPVEPPHMPIPIGKPGLQAA